MLRDRRSLYLGEVSFAFYLVHRLVLTSLQHLLPTGSRSADLGWLACSAVVAFALAVALHELVEKPARGRLLRMRGRRRTADRRTASAAA